MLIVTNRKRTYEFDIGYGYMRVYRCAIAESFGVGTEYKRATRWRITDEEFNYWVALIEEKIPRSLCKFLFACDSIANFRVRQCEELYCLLKSAKLPTDFNTKITVYGKTFDLHEAFIEAFRIGRHKGVGVEWW
nr:MAG: hypothetical protein [Bacteriophage sp.]